MRAFIAVPLPSDMSVAAAALLPDHAALRRVAPELMHLTLAFLGDLAPGAVPSVEAAVAEAAGRHRRFALRLDRVGRFPASGPPRIVWLGVGDGRDRLGALGADLRSALTRHGVPFDDKPLQAHVTLARVRERATPDDTRAVEALLRAARVTSLEADLDEVVLYESVLGRGGPRYTRRAAVALGGVGRTT